MPRSVYIYVVMASTLPRPAAAFTVKRELVRWLEKHSEHSFRVFRVVDSWWRPREVTDISEKVSGSVGKESNPVKSKQG